MEFERSVGEDLVDDRMSEPVDDRSLDTPNCAVCLHPMEVRDTAAGTPFWACTSCGGITLS